MNRAEHEIGRRAVPSAHFDIHGPHADGGGGGAAQGQAVIGHRPDHHGGPQQAVEQEAQPEGDDADDEDEHRHEHDRDRKNQEVDQERHHPPRQHALEQFGVGGGIIGVRLELNRDAETPGFAGGHDSQSPIGSVRKWAKPAVLQGAPRRNWPQRVLRLDCLEGSPELERAQVTVSIADIEAARRVIAGHVLRTPMLPAPRLSALTGAEVLVKYENLQVTNSFKERGARTKLASLSAAERARGVIAMSAGNHAQAVAYHAARLGIPATIVMPVATPAVKVAATRGYGAEVVLDGETLSEAQV